MRATFIIIMLLVYLMYAGGTKITLSPFSITVQNLELVIGVLLIFTGTVFIFFYMYNQGVDNTLEELKEEIEFIKNLKEKYSEKI